MFVDYDHSSPWIFYYYLILFSCGIVAINTARNLQVTLNLIVQEREMRWLYTARPVEYDPHEVKNKSKWKWYIACGTCKNYRAIKNSTTPCSFLTTFWMSRTAKNYENIKMKLVGIPWALDDLWVPCFSLILMIARDPLRIPLNM
jgi:hypothetical protein